MILYNYIILKKFKMILNKLNKIFIYLIAKSFIIFLLKYLIKKNNRNYISKIRLYYILLILFLIFSSYFKSFYSIKLIN